MNAIALAGVWYTWFLKLHEEDPGPAKHWRKLSDHLVWDVIRPEAPESYEDNLKADPRWGWAKEPDIREAIRPRIAEIARVATFLASEGVALNNSAHALFVDAVSDRMTRGPKLGGGFTAGDFARIRA